MQLSKNKRHQYLFFLLILLVSIFNGGNSNLLIQINFLFWSILFLFCVKDKNYILHLKNFINSNQKSLNIFFLFLLYLLFQLVYLPKELIKIFSYEKYLYLDFLNFKDSNSISLSPSDTYFQILNFISIFLSLLILKMIFYKNTHTLRFYFFMSLLGTLHSGFAIFLYLNGNPEIIFVNNYYNDSATGFFINRTVFSIFLLFCLICSLEYLKNIEKDDRKKSKNEFFSKIYVRLFIIFITIGIITSFSRLGNFLLLTTLIFYFINNQFFEQNKSKFFNHILIFIILFDIFILGLFFGSDKLFDRFSFINEDLNLNNPNSISRFEIINFAIIQIKNFYLFGYGLGGFETLYKWKFIHTSNIFANHAHSSVVEYFGELGLLGFLLLILSFGKIFFKKNNYNFVFILLLTLSSFILLFDFSLHIPINQIIFVNLFLISNINNKNIIQ